SDQGNFSIYEFLYSFRDSIDADLPEIGSQEYLNALEMIKKVKNTLSSDAVFRSNESHSFDLLMNNNAIFIKYWIMRNPLLKNIKYKMALLPGSKEGLSCSTTVSTNIGIGIDINKEKINDAIIVLKFITSKAIQKKYLMENQLISGINSLYDDEEVCTMINCDIYKNIQSIIDPLVKLDDQEYYSTSLRNYIFDFLYGNLNAPEACKKIIDLTKIYTISIYSKDYFLLILVIGSVIVMCTPFTSFGDITEWKCLLDSFTQSLGFTLILVPILYELIIRYPNQNSITVWIEDHRYLFISLFVLFSVVCNGLFYFQPHTIEEIRVDEEFVESSEYQEKSNMITYQSSYNTKTILESNFITSTDNSNYNSNSNDNKPFNTEYFTRKYSNSPTNK
ncbi:hypothetical protein PIROE2DRAFT_16936, partial [Piromyces sp. E2]